MNTKNKELDKYSDRNTERMFSFLTRNHKKTGDTINPLSGECLHHCIYCYVKQLKELFPACKAKYSGPSRIDPKQLAYIKKFTVNDYVFLCDCTDLFGYWVPTELIKQIFEAIEASPAKFLMLTKNPKRYLELNKYGIQIPKNCVLGATIESNINHLLTTPTHDRIEAIQELSFMVYPTMVSIEPIMKFTDTFPFLIEAIRPRFVAVGYDNYGNKLIEPTLAETEALIKYLEKAGITVYRKTLREANKQKELT